jgi:hypothetical protein
MQQILSRKCRPWGNERYDLNFRPESVAQSLGVRFGDQGYGISFGSGLKEWRGNEQIAQSPQFHN